MSSLQPTAALLALSLAATAAAQEPPAPSPSGRPDAPAPGMMRRMGPPMGMGPEMMVFQPSHLINRRDLLNLTPDQVARLEALSQEAARTRTQADSIARLRHEQIRELWKAEAPDVAQIRSHAQAAMQAQQNAMLAGLEAAARAKALLSAEQRGRVGGWADRPGREPQMRMQMRPPMRGRRMMRGGGR